MMVTIIRCQLGSHFNKILDESGVAPSNNERHIQGHIGSTTITGKDLGQESDIDGV